MQSIGALGGGGGADIRRFFSGWTIAPALPLRALLWRCTIKKLSETREWRPLLTVETEVNGDSKSTNERGPSLVMFVGRVVPVQETLFCLNCSSWPSTKYIFLTIHYFNSFVPIAQQAGQAAILGRLSLSMSLWRQHTIWLLDAWK